MTQKPLDTLSTDILAAIRARAGRFPVHVQRLGRAYVDKVGALKVEASQIGATVEGGRPYQTRWKWNGHTAGPRCTCPSGPVCKHAFALAQAIDAAHAKPRSKPGRPPSQAAGEDLTKDIEHWARRHSEPPPRALRAVVGIDQTSPDRPSIWIEARVSKPGVKDAPRSARQLMHLSAELQRNPNLLAPPHARLLRVLAATVPYADRTSGGTRFGIRATAVNRLLDSFSNSALLTWDKSEAAAAKLRGGITPGGRLRLGDAALDIVPVSSGDRLNLSIMLAARWPDGELRRLDEIVYVLTDDELQPSLVLVDGVFWRVGEEPPAHVIRRLAFGGSLPVPETGREHFLGLLASSFTSVADALAPHMRVHPAKPVVTLDLGADDWLHLRLFAHTGGDDWRPGHTAPEVIGFELGAEGEWLRLGEDEQDSDDEVRAPLGAAPAAEPAVADEGQDAGTDADAPNLGATEGESQSSVQPVWVEVPDPALVGPAREWIGQLPLARRPAPRAADMPLGATRGAWMRLTTRALKAFAEAWEQRPEHVTFLGNERMQTLLGERGRVRLSLSVTNSGMDWFNVSAEWHSEGVTLTEADLAKLRASKTRFLKLKSGWVTRDVVQDYDAGANVLADLGVEAGHGTFKLSIAQLAQASSESFAALEALGAGAETLEAIEQLRRQVREFDGLPRVPVPAGLKATLRPYQQDGLDFLAFVTDLGLGAVLADDMGLGKTVQALAWIEWLRERDPKGGPVLVVCPASVVHNWQRESERFTPHLRVLALMSGEERHALRAEVPDHDIVITNYSLLRRDLEHWRSIPLRAAILDEAQNIKNPNAAMSRAVLELDAKYRMALTGTPIENRALDLWSIMQFVNPGYLGRRTEFVARYDRPDAPSYARRLLSARLRPVMVRRLKEQVALDLPDRIEERRECVLTPGQRKLYLAELMRSRETVERLKASPDGLMRNKIEVLAALTRLRQICCHPALAGGRKDLGSGKFDALFEVLEPLLAEGRKVLVFSQFVECLKLLAPEIKRRDIRYHMLTGATTRREKVVMAFENDPDPCVFLISLKAGGTGLNLTAAEYVVLFDPWWNPAVEAQAIDRAHRIGQTRTVIAFRMLAEGTIEEKIWELQQRKEALATEVLGEDGFARTLSRSDLDYLLG